MLTCPLKNCKDMRECTNPNYWEECVVLKWVERELRLIKLKDY